MVRRGTRLYIAEQTDASRLVAGYLAGRSHSIGTVPRIHRTSLLERPANWTTLIIQQHFRAENIRAQAGLVIHRSVGVHVQHT